VLREEPGTLSGTREEPGTLRQGVALFSLVPLVWESNPKLQGGWCKPNTEVYYPLLRACSSSAALTSAGLHTHVRTHRTSSGPAYLHTYVYLYMREEEGGCCYFWNPGLKRTFGITVSLKP